ncbi:Zinc ABC transporter, periplasmic-binding protein ZnuA [Klebsiella pneumoniae]|uniref:Zinc ABC transporter, periplasmic-binding protein ZnuA n=1 Tax=Klebsiella pneumoniae TaxID=573 RepID=A0A377XCD1_KLEPN|nr:Zinc ABC transporter, periplasmic-binding protein ZnuA [Klebsiella pneumoniae]
MHPDDIYAFLLFTFPAKAKINVIASFSVIGDMAKNIGRDRIELLLLSALMAMPMFMSPLLLTRSLCLKRMSYW